MSSNRFTTSVFEPTVMACLEVPGYGIAFCPEIGRSQATVGRAV
jgi:hypothetical protein